MTTKEIEVVARAGKHERVKAALHVCDCGNARFLVYAIPDSPASEALEQGHVHLQCTECGISFCMGERAGCES